MESSDGDILTPSLYIQMGGGVVVVEGAEMRIGGIGV